MHLPLFAFLAASLSAQAPISVAVPGLQGVNFNDANAAFYTDKLIQQLTFHGIRTVASKDIAAVLGVERQKQLLGCTNDNCRAEMAHALNVDGVLVGNVAKIGKQFQLDVRVVDVQNSNILAAASSSSDDNERWLGTFSNVAEVLVSQLATRLRRPLPTVHPTEITRTASKVRRLSWVPLVVAGAAGVTSVGLFVASRNNYSRLTTPSGKPLSVSDAQNLANAGRLEQTFGWVSAGVAIAAIATSAGMFIFGGDEVVSAGVVAGPNGATISIGGRFP